MGFSGSKQEGFTEKELEEYVNLTYFTKKEILRLYKIFDGLVHDEGDWAANKKQIRISPEQFTSLTYFECNPFSDRICRVFSTSNDSRISFDDFIDIMNVFHPHACSSLKIEYAFKIYDFNEDDLICEEDIEVIIHRLISDSKHINESEMAVILKNVFAESDLDNDRSLSFAEFEHVLTKSLDFDNSFIVRV